MADAVPADRLDTPVSIEQLDADYGTPQSGVHADWERLKAEMQPGDRLVRFASPVDSWKNLAGRAGIALVRDGKVIDAFVTMMN
jgi:hypothetical protein